MEQDYNYDNSEFKTELKNRGFVVQKPSYSNYPNTELSMPSIMNMVYLDSIAEELGKDSRVLTGIKEIRNENNAMKIFKENNIIEIDYKDVKLLKRFTNDNGKIMPRRVTGTSAKMHRKVVSAIKRARTIGLMPFIDNGSE